MDLKNIPPAQRAGYISALSVLAAIPKNVRDLIGQEVLDGQKRVEQAIYYSTSKFATVRSGAGPFTYTCAVADRQAFSYKQGDNMASAGYTSSDIATFAETNMRSGGGATNNNADFVCWGIGIEILPTSEPRLVAELIRQVFVHYSLNGGSNRTLLGKLSDFPSGGALFGSQHTKLEAGNLAESIGPVESYLANSNPNAANWYMLQKPIRWNSITSGTPDTNLAFILTNGASIALTATDRAAVAGAAPGSSGQVVAFTSPADGARGTFAELRVKLLGIEVGGRSVNS